MANILAFEISDQPGSLALLRDEQLVDERWLPGEQKTTQSFALATQAILADHGMKPADVDVVAICDGPGSFTGLRIGVTWAKVFCYSTGANAVAVNTLEVLARQANATARPLWSILNAYRKQLFVRKTLGGNEISATEIIGLEDFVSKLIEGDCIIGSGISKIGDQIPAGVEVLDQELWIPKASTLGRIASQVDPADFADYWKLSPKYYRMSAAEEKLLKANASTNHSPEM